MYKLFKNRSENNKYSIIYIEEKFININLISSCTTSDNARLCVAWQRL